MFSDNIAIVENSKYKKTLYISIGVKYFALFQFCIIPYLFCAFSAPRVRPSLRARAAFLVPVFQLSSIKTLGDFLLQSLGAGSQAFEINRRAPAECLSL